MHIFIWLCIADRRNPDRGRFDVCNLYCDPEKHNTSLIKADLGTPCDDGYFCTGESVCVPRDKYNFECAAKTNAKGPCTVNFCRSTCNSKTRQCESPCTESSCRSKPTCTPGPNEQGTCGTIPLAVPPNCTTCPCDADGASGMVCNPISGMCEKSTTSSPGLLSTTSTTTTDWNLVMLSSVGGGITGAAIVLGVLKVSLCTTKKQKTSWHWNCARCITKLMTRMLALSLGLSKRVRSRHKILITTYVWGLCALYVTLYSHIWCRKCVIDTPCMG